MINKRYYEHIIIDIIINNTLNSINHLQTITTRFNVMEYLIKEQENDILALICTFRTIKENAQLKTTCIYFDKLISNNDLLEQFYYTEICNSILKEININDSEIKIKHNSTTTTFINILTTLIYPISPINNTFDSHLFKTHCNNDCKYFKNVIQFIKKTQHTHLQSLMDIERTINNTSLSIHSQINRYFHDIDNIQLYQSTNTINTKHMRHIKKSIKYYILQHSYQLIKFYTSSVRGTGYYTNLTNNPTILTLKYIKPYTINNFFINQVMSDFRLSYFIHFIPKQFRLHYLAAGGAITTRVIEELTIQHGTDIDLFAFDLSQNDHLKCISHFVSKLIIEGINFVITTGKENIQTFTISGNQNENYIDNIFHIQFIWTPATDILSVLGRFDLSICQIGITFEEKPKIYYTNAWLFTCMSSIGYYFNIKFADAFNNHCRLIKYINRGQRIWLMPNSIMKKYFPLNNHNDIGTIDQHDLFTNDFQQQYNIKKTQFCDNINFYPLFSDKFISKTHAFNQNWDSECLLLKFIADLLKLYIQQPNNNNIMRKRLANDIITKIIQLYSKLNKNCVCFF